MKTLRLLPILLAVIVMASIAIVGCRNKAARLDGGDSDSTAMGFPDTLRVATLYSPLLSLIHI